MSFKCVYRNEFIKRWETLPSFWSLLALLCGPQLLHLQPLYLSNHWPTFSKQSKYVFHAHKNIHIGRH